MAYSSRSLTAVKSRVPKLLNKKLVEEAVVRSGYEYRRRKLGPLETILLCVSLILQQNASMVAGVIQSGGGFTPAALCSARRRLTLSLLAVVNQLLIERLLREEPRVILLDCVNQYLQDTPALRRRYRRPGQKKRKLDYPQVRSLCLTELKTGVMIGRYDFSSDKHESPVLRQVLELLRPGDTLVMDRGFVSFANFHLLRERGIHFVARLPATLQAKNDGRRRFVHPGRRGSGKVVWDRPLRRTEGTTRRLWRKLPGTLELRQVSVRVGRGRSGGKIVLITDLEHASAKLISTWYRRRWEIETDFRHLKQTLNLETLRSKTVAGVKVELMLQMIAYNIVRILMTEAAKLRGVSARRISFAAATTLLLSDPRIPLSVLSVMPKRQRSSRPRRIKYRGKNYRLITTHPRPQRRVA